MARIDETLHRLRDWTNGQHSERLAAQVLHHEGYEDINPSHPSGGKDGGRDGMCTKDGDPWVYAVYFPRGEKKFTDIRKKFVSDLREALKHEPHGIAFVTNQEIRLAERDELEELAAPVQVDVFHLERVGMILDFPEMAQTRKQFLDIDPDPVPISIDLEILGEAGYFVRGDEMREWWIEHEAQDARRTRAQQAGTPLPAHAHLVGLSEPPSAEELDTRIDSWANELRTNWVRHEDHLAATAWPGLELRVHNTGQVFLNDVQIIITIDGVRGVKWRGPGQFKLEELFPPLYPQSPDPMAAVWDHIEDSRPNRPVTWKNLDGAVEIIVDLNRLPPHPEGRSDPEWSGGHSIVLVLADRDRQPAVSARWTVTAQTYGKAYTGESRTILVRAIDIGESFSAVAPVH